MEIDMNETDMKEEIKTEAETEPEAEGTVPETEETAEHDATEEDTRSEIGEEETATLVSHPMFAHFARGRQGSFDQIVSSFRKMLAVLPEKNHRENVSAKMTPAASQAVSDVPLTERQRAIARAAGMTYREYYSFLNK